MDILDQIAEARIQEALRAGELSNLPGAGKPLQLDDDSMIPKELRPDVEDTAERARALLCLEMLRMRLQISRQQPTNLHLEEQYYQRLVQRLERTAK